MYYLLQHVLQGYRGTRYFDISCITNSHGKLSLAAEIIFQGDLYYTFLRQYLYYSSKSRNFVTFTNQSNYGKIKISISPHRRGTISPDRCNRRQGKVLYQISTDWSRCQDDRPRIWPSGRSNPMALLSSVGWGVRIHLQVPSQGQIVTNVQLMCRLHYWGRFFMPGSTKFLVGFGIILFLIELLFRFGYVDVLLESCLVYSWLVIWYRSGYASSLIWYGFDMSLV